MLALAEMFDFEFEIPQYILDRKMEPETPEDMDAFSVASYLSLTLDVSG